MVCNACIGEVSFTDLREESTIIKMILTTVYYWFWLQGLVGRLGKRDENNSLKINNIKITQVWLQENKLGVSLHAENKRYVYD